MNAAAGLAYSYGSTHGATRSPQNLRAFVTARRGAASAVVDTTNSNKT